MKIFGLKTCDTCRKALKSFPEAELVDVRAVGVPEEVMKHATEVFGEKLLNTRSTTWRGLSEAERDADQDALLRAHPALMKRPLIAVDNQLFLGWNSGIEAEVKTALSA